MKKRFIRFCLASLACFALLYGFVMLRSAIPVTVHDEQLRLNRVSIPAGSNAFEVLQMASTHLWWPVKKQKQFFTLANDTNWDAGLAGMVLSSNRQALAEWDAAAELPDMQVPEVTQVGNEPPYLNVWKELALAAMVRENFLLHHGRDREAFDQILSQIQIGRRIQNARGDVIVYLVGSAISNLGLSQLRHWSGRAHLDPADLKNYLRELDLDPGAEGATFANTCKVEYQCVVGTLDALRKGEIIDADTGSYYPQPSLLVPKFNFSQTKKLFASGFLPLIMAAPCHYGEAQLPDLNSNQPGMLSLILSGNAGGWVMFRLLMPTEYSSRVNKSRADVQLQAARTILALRGYQLTHGNLPADLSALVPEWLDKVPVDDFDGHPLRYSRDRKIVYSVGPDLKDDGGDDGIPPRTRPLDLVYHFDF